MKTFAVRGDSGKQNHCKRVKCFLQRQQVVPSSVTGRGGTLQVRRTEQVCVARPLARCCPTAPVMAMGSAIHSYCAFVCAVCWHLTLEQGARRAMFKRFTPSETISNKSQAKTSVARTIRAQILEQYPSLAAPLETLWAPKKCLVELIKCRNGTTLVAVEGRILFFQVRIDGARRACWSAKWNTTC